MTETPEQAQAGVADALHDLSENSRALVRHEIAAAQREMLGKARQALPALGLLGAAGVCGILSGAAAFRLSIRLLEKRLPLAAIAVCAGAASPVLQPARAPARALGRPTPSADARNRARR